MSDIRSNSECFIKLMKEDTVLYEHLDKIGALSLPFYSLVGSGLAGPFSPALLEKLWDKVLEGSVKMLVAALSRYRQLVLAAETGQKIERILYEMMLKTDWAEKALTSGLDFWVEDGCSLMCGQGAAQAALRRGGQLGEGLDGAAGHAHQEAQSRG